MNVYNDKIENKFCMAVPDRAPGRCADSACCASMMCWTYVHRPSFFEMHWALVPATEICWFVDHYLFQGPMCELELTKNKYCPYYQGIDEACEHDKHCDFTHYYSIKFWVRCCQAWHERLLFWTGHFLSSNWIVLYPIPYAVLMHVRNPKNYRPSATNGQLLLSKMSLNDFYGSLTNLLWFPTCHNFS